MTAFPVLSGVYIYPLKSARGVALSWAHASERGLDLDRCWMVVDERGQQVTAREHPELSLVEPALEAGGLKLSAPGLPDLRLPYAPGPEASRRAASVWGQRQDACEASPEAGGWISAYLGGRYGLVRLLDTSRRRMQPEHGGARLSFVDGSPLHLVGEGSLGDLGARLAQPVDAARFRPNLLVAGAAPFAEDGWHQLRVGEATLEVVEPCARCAMLGVERGERHAEPLRTLAGYRRVEGQVLFGQNLVVRAAGRLAVGDRVEVLAPTPPRAGWHNGRKENP